VPPATNRRDFLKTLRNLAYAGATGIVVVPLASKFFATSSPVATAATATSAFEVSKTEAEWKSQLSPQQFAVLRQHSTERPRSSPLDQEKRNGTFACAACNLALYDSAAKYESGTGWPSFFTALPDAVRTAPDNTLFAVRTEVHCRRCGSHLGHVFDDGPKPTGKRYCMNGVAMQFHIAA
jgi:peptide-methionine (R)-S-oxide reductase